MFGVQLDTRLYVTEWGFRVRRNQLASYGKVVRKECGSNRSVEAPSEAGAPPGAGGAAAEVMLVDALRPPRLAVPPKQTGLPDLGGRHGARIHRPLKIRNGQLARRQRLQLALQETQEVAVPGQEISVTPGLGRELGSQLDKVLPYR